MSKTRLVSTLTTGVAALVAACWLVSGAFPLTAEPQTVSDAAGVTVDLNGSTILHRTPVHYPATALQRGVEGTVSVEVKLDSTGNVTDARVLGGPDELRPAVLQSVLDWHFTRDAAGGTRVVEVAFALAKSRVLQDGVVGGVTGGVPAGVPGGVTGGVPGFVTRDSSTQLDDSTQSHIAGIVVSGLSDQVRDQLLATLPVHKGDDVTADGLRRVSQAVKDFDEHLTFHQIRGQAGVTLLIAAGPPPRETLDEARGAVIAPDGAANPSERIKVGGNMQAMKIVRKEAPVYPELAKSARVQGVVHLAAVIAKDGTMLELHSLGGPALLIQSAMDAVRQWVYQPTYLNGQPVVVETTIDVNFTLSQ